MLFYLFPYLFIVFVSLNLFVSRVKRVKFWHLMFMIFPAFLVAFLRGNVGTDSFFYLGLFDDYAHYGESNSRYEPGFEMLGKALMALGITPRFGVALVSAITTIILCYSFSKSKNQMAVFALLLFPLYYYDFTMNGIRYGLSFSIATLAIDELYKKKYKKTLIFSLLALSIQYSSLLVLLPFIGVLIEKKYIIVLSVLLMGAFFLFPDYFAFITDRIAGKKDAYSEIFAPSLTSGLAPLLVVLLIYVNYLWFNKRNKVPRLVHVIFICEFLSFIMAKFTYAGLSFQGAFMFAMIVYLKNNSQELNISNLRNYTINLFLISIIGIVLFVKNITTVVQDELTPFLPYKFYWEEQKPNSL